MAPNAQLSPDFTPVSSISIPETKKETPVIPEYKPSLFLRLTLTPYWYITCFVYILCMIWRMFCINMVAPIVHYVVDILTLGYFEKAMTEFLNPKGGLPKPGLVSYISSSLLNKKEHHVHFAALSWVVFGQIVNWSSIIYMRTNNIGSWYGPLLVHMWYLGAVFTCGGNDLHYTAHFQISSRQKAHMFSVECINWFVGNILEPLQGFIPTFWLNHHVRIHHKESNGPDDIQGVAHFERNFRNFIWFVSDMPFQWYVRGPLTHINNKRYGIALYMLVSQTVHLVFMILVTKWDFYAAILLVWIPIAIRMISFNSTNEYIQHALVDWRFGNLDNPMYNSFILLKPVPNLGKTRGLRGNMADNFEERYHAVHHKFPQVSMTRNADYISKVPCHLVFDCNYIQYVKYIMKRDFMSLAKVWKPTFARSDPQAIIDEKLDLDEKAKLLESFTLRAFDDDEIGDWVHKPPFPHNMMVLGEIQRPLPVSE